MKLLGLPELIAARRVDWVEPRAQLAATRVTIEPFRDRRELAQSSGPVGFAVQAYGQGQGIADRPTLRKVANLARALHSL